MLAPLMLCHKKYEVHVKILRDILIKMCPGLKNSLQVIGSDCKEYIKRNLYCFSIRNTVIIYKAC